jgi:hypothetical protein
MRESTLAVFAINKTTVFQIAKGEPDCNTADIKPSTELVFARDGKSCLLVSA